MRTETVRIAELAAENHPSATVEIIGDWVWLTFDARPSDAERDKLKKAGFRWSPKRGQWSNRCGTPRRPGKLPYHPREKYGSTVVNGHAADVDAGGGLF